MILFILIIVYFFPITDQSPSVKSKNSTPSTIPISSRYIRRINSEDVSIIPDHYFNINRSSPLFKSPKVIETPKKFFVFNENQRVFRSLPEKLTCKVFEEFLEREVEVNIRPNFLKNPKTGRNLELDMYDPVTKIAIEYNGATHYEHVPFFNNDLQNQQEKDELKKKLCSDNGIILITVPYTVDAVIPNGKGGYKYVKRTPEEKEEKIKQFLYPILENLLF